MSEFLYVNASPRKGRSKSARVAEAFIEEYRTHHPDDHVRTVELASKNLPPFEGPALETKYAILHQDSPTEEQKAAWVEVERVIEEFQSADRYLFAVPMWNFGVPYPLKHYIDVITQPGYLFTYDPEKGYQGLVTGKPAMVVYARGGSYADPEMAGMDHQKPYLEQMLSFFGFTVIHSIVIEPTLMGGPDVADQQVSSAIQQARQIAATF